MAIIRVSKQPNQFSIIDRTAAEDPKLSFKAKGIMFYLLTKPDDWQLRVSDLVKRSTTGRDAVYSGIQELRDAGYITMEIIRVDGKFKKVRYTVYENPIKIDDVPDTENPDTENPDTENPDTENPEHSNTDLNDIDLNDNNIKDDDDDIDAIAHKIRNDRFVKLEDKRLDAVIARIKQNKPHTSDIKAYITTSIKNEAEAQQRAAEKSFLTHENKSSKPNTRKSRLKPKIDIVKNDDIKNDDLSPDELVEIQQMIKELDGDKTIINT